MKRIIFLFILLTSIMLITSCSEKENIKPNLADQIISVVELLDKSVESDYEKVVDKPIVFSNKDEYERFNKQYFKLDGIENFNFHKYDLLFVNGKKINPEDDTLYEVDGIVKQGNNVRISLKTSGKVTVQDSDEDNVIYNVIYVRLDKETIPPKSNFSTRKR
jgi:hypothetical protein